MKLTLTDDDGLVLDRWEHVEDAFRLLSPADIERLDAPGATVDDLPFSFDEAAQAVVREMKKAGIIIDARRARAILNMAS